MVTEANQADTVMPSMPPKVGFNVESKWCQHIIVLSRDMWVSVVTRQMVKFK